MYCQNYLHQNYFDMPDNIYVHVHADKPLTPELKEALATMVEVAYAAHKKGLLPNEAMEKYNDNTVINFGAHKGKKLANVPASYLLWLYENNISHKPELKAYIEDNMDALKKEGGYGYRSI